MHRLPKSRVNKARLRPCAVMFAAAFGLAILSASMAHAFTIDEQSNTNSDGTAKFSDPDKRFSGAGNANSTGNQTTIRQGNTTMQFGGQQPFDQRYNNNSMFEPNGRPTGER